MTAPAIPTEHLSPAADHDRALLRRARNGDPLAFSELYERYAADVYRYIASRISYHHHVAEDLTSEVFLNAWKAIGRYEDRGYSARAWLLRLAQNEVIDFYRTRRHETSLPEHESQQPATSGPDMQIEAQSEREAVWHAVQKLPPTWQEILRLRFEEDRSYAEIAQIVGKSSVMCRQIQFQALTKLRTLLVALVLVLVGLGYGAAAGLPGDWLYAAKRGWQRAVIALGGADNPTAARVSADQRLAELEQLVATQAPAVQVAQGAEQYKQALTALIAAQSDPLVAQTMDRHATVLRSLSTQAPVEIAPTIEDMREMLENRAPNSEEGRPGMPLPTQTGAALPASAPANTPTQAAPTATTRPTQPPSPPATPPLVPTSLPTATSVPPAPAAPSTQLPPPAPPTPVPTDQPAEEGLIEDAPIGDALVEEPNDDLPTIVPVEEPNDDLPTIVPVEAPDDDLPTTTPLEEAVDDDPSVAVEEEVEDIQPTIEAPEPTDDDPIATPEVDDPQTSGMEDPSDEEAEANPTE